MDHILFVAVIALVCMYAIESVRLRDPTIIGNNTGKRCKELNCEKPKACPYGRIMKFGCETCICNDPCNPQRQPMVCPMNQQCSVHKNANGIFEARCITPTTKTPTTHKVVTAATAKSTTGKVVNTTTTKPKNIKGVTTATIKPKGDKTDKPAPTKADCKLPKLVGTCRALMPRFYYNSATKTCQEFGYGGCDGNANNFDTIDQCEKVCMDKA